MTKSILQMDPTPNIGVFLNFVHSFLTEVDFTLRIRGEAEALVKRLLLGLGWTVEDEAAADERSIYFVLWN